MRDLLNVEGVDTFCEVFDKLHEAHGAVVERIVSHGQATDWLEQDHDEWVVVLRGHAVLDLGDGGEVALTAGQWLTIASGVRHRVVHTDRPTVWLAVHFPSGSR